jgi:hypothetical protein
MHAYADLYIGGLLKDLRERFGFGPQLQGWEPFRSKQVMDFGFKKGRFHSTFR